MAKFFKRTLGVDLGTVNTLIFEKDRGVVLEEPTVVAISAATGGIAGVGREALALIKEAPGEYLAKYPLKEGAISDYYMTEHLIKKFLRKTTHPSPLKSIKVVLCVPCNITEVEKKAAIDATVAAGARDVYLLEEPVAATIGWGLAPDNPLGCMVVDIGGGTTDIAVIAYGGIVAESTLNFAGNAVDDEIKQRVAKDFNTDISMATAERIKISIGTLQPEGRTLEISGRDMKSGLPVRVVVTDDMTCEILKGLLIKIVTAIGNLLMNTPPELSSDIARGGIVLTGGMSQLKGCADYINNRIGVSVYVCEPTTLVAKGAGMALLKR